MKSWKVAAVVLGVFLSAICIAAALVPAYKVPFRQEQIESVIKQANIETHEPRIQALERGQQETTRKLDAVMQRFSDLELSLTRSLTKIETLVGGMASGVDDARTKASDAKVSVQSYQVEMDAELEAMRAEQRRLHSLPPEPKLPGK